MRAREEARERLEGVQGGDLSEMSVNLCLVLRGERIDFDAPGRAAETENLLSVIAFLYKNTAFQSIQ